MKRTTLDDITLVNLRTISDDRGSLVPIESGVDCLIEFKRLFYVYGSTKEVRGRHAHKRTKQFFICIHGKCIVKCDDGTNKKEFVLDEKNKGLLLPEMIWAEQFYMTDDTVLLVLCDKPYNEKEYIREYDQFKSKK
jgi:dTDP-4-dehydrorhamnose 3,5-epimerase-like enzyme